MRKKVFEVTNLVCVLLGIVLHSFFVFCLSDPSIVRLGLFIRRCCGNNGKLNAQETSMTITHYLHRDTSQFWRCSLSWRGERETWGLQ